jgi:hypothetical protein
MGKTMLFTQEQILAFPREMAIYIFQGFAVFCTKIESDRITLP